MTKCVCGEECRELLKKSEFRAEKIEYEDGIGCCIWRLFPNSDNEDIGHCWDFAYDDIDDILYLLNELKEIPAELYIEE